MICKLFLINKLSVICIFMLHGIQTWPDYDFMKETAKMNYLRNMSQSINKTGEVAEAKNDTEYSVDGISHFKVTENNPQLEKVKMIEKEIDELLTMKGVTYSYFRDTYWRTWREVENKSGNKTVVHYRLESSANLTFPNRSNSGFWTIEDDLPPCPYEIVSVINDDTVCAVSYSQLNEDLGPCPTIITYRDVTKTCDNPIVTKWRVDKLMQQNISEETNMICEKPFCEFLTTYHILPEYVVFRIVNANDTIIYSRIMKNDNMTYVCVEDCGRYNKKTMTVETETDDNVSIIDLVESLPPKKNKKKNQSLLAPILKAHFYKVPMLKIPALVKKEKGLRHRPLPMHTRFNMITI